eukprot:m.185285 g.185285  ORF g.185285 m.185285 type:complete len:385 (+) comp32227_c0_seq2:97-1251(+)
MAQQAPPKIVSVQVHVLQAPCTPFAFSQRWVSTRVGLVVEIKTDTGITGWGDGYGPPWAHEAIIKHYLAPKLIGMNALAGDKIWEEMYNELRDHGQKGVVIQALSALDCAVWDIRGKHFNTPVHVLMGGPIRSTVQAYATGFYRKSDNRVENHRLMEEEAKSYLAQGFTAMKIKVGFGLEDDVALVKHIREIVGDSVQLFIDANHGYDVIGAIAVARAVEKYNIGWFEEPVEPEDLAGYRAVKAATSIPIAGGECDFTRYGFRDILLSKSIDIIQPDTAAAGGLTECKKIADMAMVMGVRYNPHCWGTGIGLSVALQLLAVLPNAAPAMNAHQPMLEYDLTEHPFRQGLLKTPIKIENGIAHVPTGVGLGIEINRDVLLKYKIN